VTFGLLRTFYTLLTFITQLHSNQGIYTPSELLHRQIEAIVQVLHTYRGHAVREKYLHKYNKYSIKFCL